MADPEELVQSLEVAHVLPLHSDPLIPLLFDLLFLHLGLATPR